MHLSSLSSGTILLLVFGILVNAASLRKQDKVKRSLSFRKNALREMHQRRATTTADNTLGLPPNIYALLQNYAYASNQAYPRTHPQAYPQEYPQAYYPTQNGYYLATPEQGYYLQQAPPSATVPNLYAPNTGNTNYPASVEYYPSTTSNLVSPEAIPANSLPVIPISEGVKPLPTVKEDDDKEDEEDAKEKNTTTEKTAKETDKKEDEDEEDEDEPDEEDFDAEDLVER